MNSTSNQRQELMRKIREGKITPERNGSYWGEEERSELISLYQEGVGITELALRFERSESAIFQQIVVMDLITPPEARRPKVKKTVIPCCLCGECLCTACLKKQDCVKEG